MLSALDWEDVAEGPVEKITIAKEERKRNYDTKPFVPKKNKTVVAISATEQRLPAWVIES